MEGRSRQVLFFRCVGIMQKESNVCECEQFFVFVFFELGLSRNVVVLRRKIQ